MDSTWMNSMAQALAAAEVRTFRFEFGYMAARRSGDRKPPPHAESLLAEYRDVVSIHEGPVLIGGKSMGGRVASMIADELFGTRQVAGLVCFGYPFHPPSRPDQLRTKHLVSLQCPTLIVQGESDPFGTRQEVESYQLSSAIEVEWVTGADHDLKGKGPDGRRRTDHCGISWQVTGWISRVVALGL
jgi:predicted alpha/beta-hydrolase family hydrolase